MKRAIYFIYREIARDRAKSQVDLLTRDDPRFRVDIDRGIGFTNPIGWRKGGETGDGRRETGEVKGERREAGRGETGDGRRETGEAIAIVGTGPRAVHT